jgi:8-oxo-dGTP diphosphatase
VVSESPERARGRDATEHASARDSNERAHAAVAIVRAIEGDSLLLLRRRDSERDHWSGHWCFPGGRRHPEDADLLATALRELREECALELSREALTGELPVGRAGGATKYVLVKPFVLSLPAPVAIVPHEAEMQESRWLPVAELRDESRHAMRAVPGHDAPVASFDLPPVPLWGFTYRLACEVAGISAQ